MNGKLKSLKSLFPTLPDSYDWRVAASCKLDAFTDRRPEFQFSEDLTVTLDASDELQISVEAVLRDGEIVYLARWLDATVIDAPVLLIAASNSPEHALSALSAKVCQSAARQPLVGKPAATIHAIN